MKRNVELLRKTADRIEQVPESYNQTIYRCADKNAPCGTVACLAGEIIICSAPTVEEGLKRLWSPGIYIAEYAAQLAGFTAREVESLFETAYGSSWPEPFSLRYYEANTNTGRAKVAADLLRYLADGGKV